MGPRTAWLLILCCFCYSAVIRANQNSVPHGTPGEALPDEVLHSLLRTPLGKTLPALPYSITKVQTYVPNAFSHGDGQLYVTAGTYLVLGKQRGLWAGLLGHELGHMLLHNPESLSAFERELRKDCEQARRLPHDYASAGETAAPPSRPAPAAIRFIDELNRHGRHEPEYQADVIGLMLMAEAGYHPMFFLALGRDFNFYLGAAKVTSFFAAHPDWGSRQKRLMEVYDSALSIFDSLWPEVAQSPGGKLPALGSIGKVIVALDPADKTLWFRVPVRLENPANKPIRVAVTLFDNNKRVPSALDQYRSADGFLVANTDIPSSPRFADEVTIRIPLKAIAAEDRRLRAAIYLATGDEPIAETRLSVELPEH
jgi:hypothetical protein